MQDKERDILKANAVQLADLLTENVPYLIGHYLKDGVLTESEREDIIQAESAQEIRIKLVKTLAEKEGVSLEAVIEGLNATGNETVSKEINDLLSENKTEDDGSGDKTVSGEDLSAYATNLVDEVIAKAEKTTASQSASEEEETEGEKTSVIAQEESVVEQQQQPTNGGEPTEEFSDKLVETSVEVHTAEDDANEKDENVVGVNDESIAESNPTQESIADVNEIENNEEEDVPDRSVNFSATVATVIEDEKQNYHSDEEVSSSPTSPTTATPSKEEYNSHRLDAQNESENEDVDTIDIEKEFVMPSEAETNINNNSFSNGTVANGRDKFVRMESNDIVLDDDKKEDESKNNNEGIEDSELAAVLARKALVRQQVEMFEKNSPGGGKVKYSFGTASPDKDAEKSEGNGSNVKNLKNFFQQLSTSDSTKAPPPSGPVKSVGKLKVTFPASS